MKWTTQLAVFAGLVTPGISSAGDTNRSYVDNKGNLTQTLLIKHVQGGFAGDTGWLWKIEKDGAWKKLQVFNQKLTPKAKGMLNAKERMRLAEILSKYKLLQLPAKTGKPSTNRQLLTIQFGKHSSSFIFRAGTLLPKADTKTVAGRFGGVVHGVKELTKSDKGTNDN